MTLSDVMPCAGWRVVVYCNSALFPTCLFYLNQICTIARKRIQLQVKEIWTEYIKKRGRRIKGKDHSLDQREKTCTSRCEMLPRRPLGWNNLLPPSGIALRASRFPYHIMSSSNPHKSYGQMRHLWTNGMKRLPIAPTNWCFSPLRASLTRSKT